MIFKQFILNLCICFIYVVQIILFDFQIFMADECGPESRCS